MLHDWEGSFTVANPWHGLSTARFENNRGRAHREDWRAVTLFIDPTKRGLVGEELRSVRIR
jgi:hypothetical protein